MIINGCHIVSEHDPSHDLNAFPDGYRTTVRKKTIVEKEVLNEKGYPVRIDESVVESDAVGPFRTIDAAVRYAHAWNDLEKPPVVPDGVIWDGHVEIDVNDDAGIQSGDDAIEDSENEGMTAE